ncbi:hypothetical protein CEUSTIGMA_g2727.t1 [Chlamydomonas eustigma]|uniref:Protein-serine/threonine phosphatase n=1 Tax=Chlamydomonas eustigma TaxID=1157962 RepID=A0A250WXD2_9CHLO|nr:hypothetical protein CEUSTIGMA_g2727.t1 [Chlamydomonas eustigma]|eukprot:GAX75282.1 hypothetical protein CEUSTIGMA_g2727.t1 [Chlamydomonas eustigma]
MKKSIITRQYVLGLIEGRNNLRESAEEEPRPSMIMPGLILSGKSFERDILALEGHGVTHILQVGVELTPSHAQHFQYKKVSIFDLEEEDIVCALSGCYDFIDNGMRKGVVVVHCAAGVSRSASVVIAFVMQKHGVNFTTARNLVKRARPCVNPNLGFTLQLQQMDAQSWQGFQAWQGWNLHRFLQAKSQVIDDRTIQGGCESAAATLNDIEDSSQNGLFEIQATDPAHHAASSPQSPQHLSLPITRSIICTASHPSLTVAPCSQLNTPPSPSPTSSVPPITADMNPPIMVPPITADINPPIITSIIKPPKMCISRPNTRSPRGTRRLNPAKGGASAFHTTLPLHPPHDSLHTLHTSMQATHHDPLPQSPSTSDSTFITCHPGVPSLEVIAAAAVYVSRAPEPATTTIAGMYANRAPEPAIVTTAPDHTTRVHGEIETSGVAAVQRSEAALMLSSEQSLLLLHDPFTSAAASWLQTSALEEDTFLQTSALEEDTFLQTSALEEDTFLQTSALEEDTFLQTSALEEDAFLQTSAPEEDAFLQSSTSPATSNVHSQRAAAMLSANNTSPLKQGFGYSIPTRLSLRTALPASSLDRTPAVLPVSASLDGLLSSSSTQRLQEASATPLSYSSSSSTQRLQEASATPLSYSSSSSTQRLQEASATPLSYSSSSSTQRLQEASATPLSYSPPELETSSHLPPPQHHHHIHPTPEHPEPFLAEEALYQFAHALREAVAGPVDVDQNCDHSQLSCALELSGGKNSPRSQSSNINQQRRISHTASQAERSSKGAVQRRPSVPIMPAVHAAASFSLCSFSTARCPQQETIEKVVGTATRSSMLLDDRQDVGRQPLDSPSAYHPSAILIAMADARDYADVDAARVSDTGYLEEFRVSDDGVGASQGEVGNRGLLSRTGSQIEAENALRRCLGQTSSSSSSNGGGSSSSNGGGVVLPSLMQSKSWIGSRPSTSQSVLSSISFGSTGASVREADVPGSRYNSRSSSLRSDSSGSKVQLQQHLGDAGPSSGAVTNMLLGRLGSSRTVPVIPFQLPRIVSGRAAAATAAAAMDSDNDNGAAMQS